MDLKSAVAVQEGRRPQCTRRVYATVQEGVTLQCRVYAQVKEVRPNALHRGPGQSTRSSKSRWGRCGL